MMDCRFLSDLRLKLVKMGDEVAPDQIASAGDRRVLTGLRNAWRRRERWLRSGELGRIFRSGKGISSACPDSLTSGFFLHCQGSCRSPYLFDAVAEPGCFLRIERPAAASRISFSSFFIRRFAFASAPRRSPPKRPHPRRILVRFPAHAHKSAVCVSGSHLQQRKTCSWIFTFDGFRALFRCTCCIDLPWCGA